MPSAAGVVAAALAMWSVGASLPGLPERRMVWQPSAPTACTGEPLICMFPESGHVQAAYTDTLDTLIDAAQRTGYTALVPDRVEQRSLTYRPGVSPGVRTFTFWVDGGEPDPSHLVLDLVTPVHCPQIADEERGPGEEYWDDLFRVGATWLALADLPRPSDPAVPALFQDHPPLTASETSDVMTRLWACQFS